MDERVSRLGSRAAVTLLAMTLAGCAAPTPGQPTLAGWLGLQSATQLRDNRANQSGNNPYKERQDPLKRIADPANAQSDNAAIAQAAKIKQQQDMAAQKIKAIKYLSCIGCSCYDKDGGVSKALQASLTDCDEEVRLATVQAIMNTASHGACQNCGSVSCCKKDIVEQLAKMAYEVDDTGCWIEPSQRVRTLAAQAAEICCPCQWPQMPAAPKTQPDNPELKKEPAGLEGAPQQQEDPPSAGTDDAALRTRLIHRDRAIAMVHAERESLIENEMASPPAVARTSGASPAPADEELESPGRAFICNHEEPIVVFRNVAVPVPADRWPTGSPGPGAARSQRPNLVSHRGDDDGRARGIVRYVDQFHGVAHVEFGGKTRIAPGTRIVVEHHALFGKLASTGLLEVVSSEPGAATVKALGDYRISRVASGDQVYVAQGNS